MVAFIKGELNDIYDDYIVLEVNGIGYEIKVPLSVISKLPPVGEKIKLHTFLSHKEDAMILFGFLTRDDLEVFKKLITVNGIGPKGALGVLSTITSDELRFAIMANDINKIAKSPGIGKKTAQKLILELKDKLKLTDVSSNEYENIEEITNNNDIAHEAIQALVTLGYTNTEAVQTIRKIEIAEGMTLEDLIKYSLKYLAKI